MFKLDFRSREPIYEQLKEKLKELIIHNVLKQDEQLPSVRELAVELTINPNTIQKAYRELENQGYIYSIQGKGSFVRPIENIENSRQKAKLLAQLQKLAAELLYLGISREEILELVKKAGKGGGEA